MGYFDKAAENYFKETTEGEVIYYPNGVLGKGRLVPDSSTKEELFSFQKRVLKITFLVIFPYVWLMGIAGVFTLGSFSPIILFVIYYLYKQHMLTRCLKKHHVKLGFKEAATKGSKNIPNWYYKITMAFSVLIMVLALCLPVMFSVPFAKMIVPVIGILSFGLLGLALSVRMFQLKNLTGSSDETSQSGAQ